VLDLLSSLAIADVPGEQLAISGPLSRRFDPYSAGPIHNFSKKIGTIKGGLLQEFETNKERAALITGRTFPTERRQPAACPWEPHPLPLISTESQRVGTNAAEACHASSRCTRL